MKKFTLCLLLLSLFVGCGEQEKKEYFESGEVSVQSFYKGDKKHGKSTEFYESGVVSKKLNYRNGDLSGENVTYYPDGKIKSIINYRDGKNMVKQHFTIQMAV